MCIRDSNKDAEEKEIMFEFPVEKINFLDSPHKSIQKTYSYKLTEEDLSLIHISEPTRPY